MKIIPFPRTLDAERQRLIDYAMRYGLADERTIRQSQVVDELANVVQRRRYGWHKNKQTAAHTKIREEEMEWKA